VLPSRPRSPRHLDPSSPRRAGAGRFRGTDAANGRTRRCGRRTAAPTPIPADADHDPL